MKRGLIVTEFRLLSRARGPAALLAAAVVLAACAAGGGSWSKAGVGGEAMAADVDECEFFGQTAMRYQHQPDHLSPNKIHSPSRAGVFRCARIQRLSSLSSSCAPLRAAPAAALFK